MDRRSMSNRHGRPGIILQGSMMVVLPLFLVVPPARLDPARGSGKISVASPISFDYVPRPDRMAGGAFSLFFWLLLHALLLGGVPHSATAGMPDHPNASVAALESRTFKLVNDHRSAIGLAPLVHDARIAAVARRHSRNMAEGRVPAGHDGFETRRRDISKRIPLRGIAENVGANDYPRSDTVRAAVSGWLESRGHRENIEGRYDLTGVGIARDSRGVYYYTQIFIRRKQ
ncbi:MAG: CAP domain-containing protein [Deltaproteobacteria bacterium]|nr:CAP domain-containing protein [Deltaproteobacteria bacterium]